MAQQKSMKIIEMEFENEINEDDQKVDRHHVYPSLDSVRLIIIIDFECVFLLISQ